jgi:DNA-binding transcriptional regulator LsrR (DeoR family)
MMTVYRNLWNKNPRVARALYLRLQYDLTFAQIAEELGVSVARARQLVVRGCSMAKKICI